MRHRQKEGKIAPWTPASAGAPRVTAVLALATVVLAFGCSDDGLQRGTGTETRRDGGDTTKGDGGADAGDEDGAVPIKPSGCPAPEKIAPEDVPSGFLPAEKVSLLRVVDGDTAHFDVPGKGDTVVRFLYVNTEETHGAETTQFGVDASYHIGERLKAASEIHVAPEEDKQRPGSPHLDAFDRTLALVFVDGDLFQTRMIRDGWTPYYTQFGCAPGPIHDALLWSEAEARANERGVWTPGHPTDYSVVLRTWIGSNTCRPNPYRQSYCGS